MNQKHGLIYLYPVWIRIWHILNASLCLILIVTGLSMQYSSESTIISFNSAVTTHNMAGVLLSGSYLIFFLGNLFTKNGRHYRVLLRGFNKRLMIQFSYYTWGYFRKQDPPFPVTQDSKFNPLQQFSYVAVMYLFLPFLILTGWGLLFPLETVGRIMGESSINITDMIHVISGFLVSVFLCFHIYFCTMGKKVSSDFKSIINGYHESH